MAYDVLTYIQQRDPIRLERMFKLLEPLVRIAQGRQELVRRSMEDPEWGKMKLAEIQAELDDLKLDMQNIALAIECLKNGA